MTGRAGAVEELAPQARAAGVSRTVFVQTVTVAEEPPELPALARGSDLIGAVVGRTDLTRPDVADEPARLRELPGGRHLKGVRHQAQGEPDPEWLLRDDVGRGLAAVADAGPVHDLVVLDHQLPACVRAAGRHPELTFVLDHLGEPLSPRGNRTPGPPPSAPSPPSPPSPPCRTPSASSPVCPPGRIR